MFAVAVQAPGTMVAGVAGGVAGGVGVGVGCGEVTAGDDAVGDGMIAAGLVADAQAATSRVTTTVAAARAIEERIGSPCEPADYGSMIVVVQRTVLSGSRARRLAEEVSPASGSIASA
jgi:hypothetical protein